MRKITIWSILFVLILIVSACGVSTEPETEVEEPLDKPKEEPAIDKNTIILAIGEWAPYVSADLQNFGFTAEIVTKSFNNVGIDVKYEFYPWARALEATRSSDIAGTFPWVMNQEREAMFNITETFCASDKKFVFLKDNPNMPADYNSVENFKDVRVTGIQGFAQIDLMKELGFEFDITNNEDVATAKLMAGRIDTFATDPLVSMEYIKQNYPDMVSNIEFLKTPLIHLDMGILMSKSYPDSDYYIQKFNEGYQVLLDSGEYNKILVKHGLEVIIED